MRRLLALLLLISVPAFAQFGMNVPLRTNAAEAAGCSGTTGTIVLVQATNVLAPSGFGICAVAPSSNITVGNTLVFFVSPNNGPVQNVSDTLGNTWRRLIVSPPSDFPASAWLATITHGGSDTISVNGVTETSGCAVSEYSGVSTSTPVDNSGANGADTGVLSWPVGPVNMGRAGDTLLSVVLQVPSTAGNPPSSVPTGFTQDYNGYLTAGGYLRYQTAVCLALGAGSYSAAWTNASPSTPSAQWNGFLIGLIP